MIPVPATLAMLMGRFEQIARRLVRRPTLAFSTPGARDACHGLTS